ncbi:MAG: riboflavin biosynthesis protein RibF, partial [Sphingobacteriales bacterium]|nr:riboflavin biosynthesis protein RibF [Sphingobacteriales bacterium]
VACEKPTIQLLNTLEEKIDLLEKQQVDNLVIVPFTDAFSNLTAEEYISNFLVEKFHPHTIIIGHDHHFGKGRTGNYALLEEKSSIFHYTVKEIPAHMLLEVTISSTKIRQSILNGDIEIASKFLGYPYFFSGKVVKGNQLGRTIGYPTANLQMEDEFKLIPGNGVYAVELEKLEDRRLKIEDKSTQHSKLNSQHTIYKGMMNIGIRPTVDGTRKVIEVNIFDFDKDIYGETLIITLKKYLRSEEKFNGIEALKVQLARDKENTLKALR